MNLHAPKISNWASPATISKCPLMRRTTSGENTPRVPMLAASSSSRSSSNSFRGLVGKDCLVAED